MVRGNKMSDDERRWRAEDDARTLKRLAEIEGDKVRKQEALKILKEEQKQLNKVLKNKKR